MTLLKQCYTICRNHNDNSSFTLTVAKSNKASTGQTNIKSAQANIKEDYPFLKVKRSFISV